MANLLTLCAIVKKKRKKRNKTPNKTIYFNDFFQLSSYVFY